MCCGYSRSGVSADERLRDVIKCAFSVVFHYVFLPSALAFELAWSLQLATSSVKTITFVLTGSHAVFHGPNSTVPVNDAVYTNGEIALGALVMVCSGLTMFAYMWIRAKAKATNRRGRLIPYRVRPDSVPLAWQEMTDPNEQRMRDQVDADTMAAFVIAEDDEDDT